MGTIDGVRGSAAFRRVGAHRQWDADGLEGVCKLPWFWNLEADVHLGCLRVRFLTEEEKISDLPQVYEEERVVAIASRPRFEPLPLGR